MKIKKKIKYLLIFIILSTFYKTKILVLQNVRLPHVSVGGRGYGGTTPSKTQEGGKTTPFQKLKRAGKQPPSKNSRGRENNHLLKTRGRENNHLLKTRGRENNPLLKTRGRENNPLRHLYVSEKKSNDVNSAPGTLLLQRLVEAEEVVHVFPPNTNSPSQH